MTADEMREYQRAYAARRSAYKTRKAREWREKHSDINAQPLCVDCNSSKKQKTTDYRPRLAA